MRRSFQDRALGLLKGSRKGWNLGEFDKKVLYNHFAQIMKLALLETEFLAGEHVVVL